MPKQPVFPVLRDAMKKKQTRRALFRNHSVGTACLLSG
jgi:hypothetical protein